MEKAQWTGSSWRIRWVDEHGKRHNVGGFKTAQEAEYYGQQKNLEIKGIKLGLRTGQPTTMSLQTLSERWLQERASLKRSQVGDELIIRVHLLPFFGHLKIHEINSSHAQLYTGHKKQSLSIKTVHNHLTLLISMLNYAFSSNWLSRVPDIKKPKLGKTPYRYLKTKEEIVALLRAAKEEGEMPYLLYKVAIFTGARAGELAALTWNKVNFDTRIITIDQSFNGPTKSDEVRYVPIMGDILEELKAWRLRCGTPHVFSNQRGGKLRESDRVFQEVLHRVLIRAGFPSVEIAGRTKRYICFHDLRHTFASHWMMNGGDIFALQKVLGHSDTSVTQRYAHLAPHAFAKDQNRFSVGPISENSVIALRPAIATDKEESSHPLDSLSSQWDSAIPQPAFLQK